jgi:uncharacterized membrane protein YsdA (DUF1294 family)
MSIEIQSFKDNKKTEKNWMSRLVIYYYLIINLVAFLAMVIDKMKAVNQKWRIKENSLHLLSFAGGVFGTIISMITLRHKIRKSGFVFITFLALLIHIYLTYSVIIY